MEDNYDILPFDEDLLLFESPGDEDEGGDNNVDLAANDNNQNNDNADDNANQDNNDQAENDDQNNDNNQGNQTNDDNFDIDDNDPGDNAEDDDQPAGGNDATPDDNGEGAEDDVTEEEKEDNAELDKIYADLTPAERTRRDLELRNQFKDLYFDIATLISDTEMFPNTSDTREILPRLLKNLRDFKKYIVYYLSNIYDTKSHLENRTVYFQYIEIYLGIKSIFDDLNTAMSHVIVKPE